jgi:Trk K+ transport system NAD-binding subunit
MKKLKRRLILMVIGFFSMIFIFAYIYMQGMAVFEGEDIRYYVAVQKTVESITTAGFGGHAPWSSLGMNLIVITMNLIGVSLFFFGVPIALAPIVIPSLKEAIRDRAPRETDKKNHIIITEFSNKDQVLVDKLSKYGYDYLLIVEDENEALRLQREGHDVVFGSAEETEVLQNANISDSKAIVTDIEDSVNPSILLSAKRYGGDTDKISVVESKDVVQYHELSGADFVLESRTAFGKALGLRSILSLPQEIEKITENSPPVQEHIVHPDNDIVGLTVEEYREQKGESILCGWFNGQFIPAPRPDKVVTENAILVTTDSDASVSDDKKVSNNEKGNIIIAGYGNVGKSVEETVTNKGFTTTTIDGGEEDADIQGDITNPEVLNEAGISDSKALVITINNDADVIYSTLVATDLSPETEIISRVNNEDNIWKVYDSGADFVISIDTLTGDVVANRIIDDKKFIAPTQDLNLKPVDGSEYSGMKMMNTDVSDTHGYVIAIEKNDGELIGNIDGETVIEEDDSMIVIER